MKQLISIKELIIRGLSHLINWLRQDDTQGILTQFQLWNQAPIGAMLVKDGLIIAANEAMQQQYHTQLGSLREFLLQSNSIQVVNQLLQQLAKNPSVHDQELRLSHCGKLRRVDLSARLIGNCQVFYFNDIEYVYDIEKKLSNLREQAQRDELTGLLNRTGFSNKLANINPEELAPFSLAIIDIDFFKKVNDTHGHQAGDFIIKSIGQIIRRSIRKNDFVFRWGGEEFLVSLKNCTKEKTTEIIEKIRLEIETTEFIFEEEDKTTPIQVTISAGVVSFNIKNKDVNSSFNRAIKKSDHLLYYVKQHGRNQVIDCLPERRKFTISTKKGQKLRSRRLLN